MPLIACLENTVATSVDSFAFFIQLRLQELDSIEILDNETRPYDVVDCGEPVMRKDPPSLVKPCRLFWPPAILKDIDPVGFFQE